MNQFRDLQKQKTNKKTSKISKLSNGICMHRKFKSKICNMWLTDN